MRLAPTTTAIPDCAARTMLAAAMATGVMLTPGVSGATDLNMAIAPLEILDSHSLCSGKGKIAYRVTFAAKQIKARFAVAGAEKSISCSITERHAGVVRKLAIPCPEDKVPDAYDKLAANLPQQVDLAGTLVGCLGLDSHEFVEGQWAISADTPEGRVENKGDLAEPSLSMGFAGPVISVQNQINLGGKPPTIALVFDRMKATFLPASKQQFSLSTYLAISPQKQAGEMCNSVSEECFDVPIDAGMIAWAFKGRQFYNVVRYVDGD